MASIKDVEQLADDLERRVGKLRSELRNKPDFGRLAQIADEIGERADAAAETFSNVNETLMSRISELPKGSEPKPAKGSERRQAASR